MSAAPVDPLAPLAWARIAFAAIVLIRTTPLIRWIDAGIGPDVHPLQGWPTSAAPVAAFGLVLGASTLKTLAITRTAAAAFVVVGLRARMSAVVAGTSALLLALSDAAAFNFTKQLVALGFFALAATDAGAVLAWVRDPLRAPIGGRRVLLAFVASVYVWAAIAKLRADWLDGRTIALFVEHHKLTGPLTRLLATPWACALAAKGVVLAELALPVGLLVPRTRKVAVLSGIAFHVVLEAVAKPDVLGWLMIALLVGLWPLGADRAPSLDVDSSTP